jgi:predicted metal-dependent RNase
MARTLSATNAAQVLGYDGPIYATHPTKAVMPILLEDYRKISVERRGVDEKDFFTSEQVRDVRCFSAPAGRR